MFDEIFLADTINTGEWFFGSLQPRYTKLRQDLISLNEVIHEELMTNSSDFDAGFYRSIMPGIVAIGAGTITKRVFSDGRIERVDSVKDVGLYIERIDEMIERKRELLENS